MYCTKNHLFLANDCRDMTAEKLTKVYTGYGPLSQNPVTYYIKLDSSTVASFTDQVLSAWERGYSTYVYYTCVNALPTTVPLAQLDDGEWQPEM